MRTYSAKTLKWIQWVFRSITWRITTNEKVIYLTFDDGPIPEVTPWVLETLAAFDAKATFFCIGDNVRKYPDIYKQLLKNGHRVGNHTFNHLNGWRTWDKNYLANIEKCSQYVTSTLFRPPYGKLKPSQTRQIRKQYQVVLWDVLSGDFDAEITSEVCLHHVIDNATKGSIVVFHDSLKAEKHLRFVLPKVLEFYKGKGFRFDVL
jgi:peptidoglycan/xylan/chitin deacetylase (PgdA/CDA1 family)